VRAAAIAVLLLAIAALDAWAAGTLEANRFPAACQPVRAQRGRVWCAGPSRRMTSQGSAHGRFTRAIASRNLFQAEAALRELRWVSLLDALDYLDLLAELRPAKLEQAALRWHGRLELEAGILTLAESQLALAALASLCAGERDAVQILRRLVRRAKPTLVA
jgi:hypothetical protein